jgi:hypothetical protein
MLVNDLEGVQVAYVFIGTAQPDVFAKAKAEGRPVPFSNHQPNYFVDLDAIPLGAKVASLIVMDVMVKN